MAASLIQTTMATMKQLSGKRGWEPPKSPHKEITEQGESGGEAQQRAWRLAVQDTAGHDDTVTFIPSKMGTSGRIYTGMPYGCTFDQKS